MADTETADSLRGLEDTPELRKLLAEQYDAGYEFCLRRVRESVEGVDPEVDYRLAELELPPKREGQ